MRRFRWARGVVMLGLAGALVGVVPSGVSAGAGRERCRATAFVTSNPVSTIDVKTRTKHPDDIPVDPFPFEVAVTPDGKTAFVPHDGVVSTIDVKTRTKHPDDIPMEGSPAGVAVTPDGKNALVVNRDSNSVWTIDVKTRKRHPTDIPVGSLPWGIAVTPNGKTAFVANMGSGTVSTIDVKTRKKHPDDIPVGAHPTGVAVTSDGKTAFITNSALVLEFAESGNTVSTIDVKTRTKHPDDITVGFLPSRVAITPCRGD
jgi:YVTN family beta-propeller protein